MRWLADGQKWLFVYYEINDDLLDIIRSNPKFYRDEKFVVTVMTAKGDNAHVFGLFHNNSDHWEVSRELTKLKKKYKTVSWWDRRSEKFYFKRGI